MSSPEPEQEIGSPEPGDEVDGEANGGSSEPEQEADFIAAGWPEGMPTFLNSEYLDFFRRANAPEAKPHDKVSMYFRSDEIYERKRYLERTERHLGIVEATRERTSQLRGQGYRNRFALPAGETHPDICWQAIEFYNPDVQRRRESAENIVVDALACYEDRYSLSVLSESIRRHTQARFDVIEELRNEWWGERSADPLQSLTLAYWIQATASYAQVTDLLSFSTSHLVAAYEDRALLFQGRSVDVVEFSRQFDIDHTSFAP